ncbi:DUF2625 domain-containing protein [Actinomadura rudentiformis]|uniref:DUF2625 domain-containing protein n=1 Tax=Actinomadura rudentiformis TaxID=359158 RepID=A0A6H9YWQ0_9ACTN|nr:DUF2625 domain-containing protein [Actinomadura rudentiformis]
MRELSELIDVDDPAWPVMLEEISESVVPVDVLPVEPEHGGRCLQQLQITVRSMLGAVVWHTGGLLLDDGWLRVYGSPAADADLPGLAQVNGFPQRFEPTWQPAGGLVVAHDVLGGVFALNGADAVGRPGAPGQMVYFAPDSLKWEALKIGHSAWLAWLLSGGLEDFYAALRWSGWREEVAEVTASEGISVVPFLWSAEAQQDLNATSRRRVPMAELLGLSREFGERLGVGDPGFLGQL